MATMTWIGNAGDVAQVDWIEIANPQAGDKFRVTINNKFEEYEAVDGDTATEVVDGLVSLIGDSDIPEFQEIEADGFTPPGFDYLLRLTAATPGVPFTATVLATNQSGFDILVSTLQEGSAGVNEVKELRFAGVPSGGTFTATFGGQITAAQPWNETAANFQADLEALSSIGAGNVAVARSGAGSAADPYVWTITFQGALAATNVGGMTGSGASLTGAGSITHETIQDGHPDGVNEIQLLTITGGGTGTLAYKLDFMGNTTTNYIQYEHFTEASEYAALFLALGDILGSDNYVLTNVSWSEHTTRVWRIEFTGDYESTDVDEMTVVDADVLGTWTTDPAIATDTEGSSSGAQNEIQRFTINFGPSGGTFDLIFQGQTAAGIAYNVDAATLTTALEGLSNIGAGEVTVTRTGSGTNVDPYVYEIEFTGTLGGLDLVEMTSNAASITGCAIVVTTTEQGVSARNEIQQVEIDGSPTAGTFTLTNDYGAGDETTSGIPFDASAAEVLAALVGATTPIAGDFAVSGSDGGPWVITYQGALAAEDFEPFVGNGTLLTGDGTESMSLTNRTASTGKHYWNNAANWSGGVVPASTDTVWLMNSSVSILYGLAQSAVTLTALNRDMSFTGNIGLPDVNENGYREYRDKYLAIGITTQTHGLGVGDGSNLVRINNGSVQTTGLIYQTGASVDDFPAFDWLGTHAANAWTIMRGSFGAAVFDNAVSTIASLTMAYPFTDDDDGAAELTVRLGAGVTFSGNLKKEGGTLDCSCTIGGTFLQAAGNSTFHGAAAITGAQEIQAGIVNWRSSGQLTGNTDVSEDGTLTFADDPRARTAAGTVTLHAGATLLDPHRSVTFSNPIQLKQCRLADVTVDFGTDISLVVANL